MVSGNSLTLKELDNLEPQEAFYEHNKNLNKIIDFLEEFYCDYKNSDKSINLSLMSAETDRLTSSGYKTNKTGFSLGSRFEYYDDFFLNIGSSAFFEDLELVSHSKILQSYALQQ